MKKSFIVKGVEVHFEASDKSTPEQIRKIASEIIELANDTLNGVHDDLMRDPQFQITDADVIEGEGFSDVDEPEIDK